MTPNAASPLSGTFSVSEIETRMARANRAAEAAFERGDLAEVNRRMAETAYLMGWL